MKRVLLLIIMLHSGSLLGAQELSLSTNLMDYANLGTLNLEASLGVSRHWSLNASAKYNPFSFRGGEVLNRQRLFALGTRFWPWHVYSGWWLSGKAQYQEYNCGGLTSAETVEGDRMGASLSGGWSYMLGKHMNIDLGLGVWGGYDIYRSYECPKCGRITGEGEKFFVLPNDIIVAFTFVF